jgi:hypothetical protein
MANLESVQLDKNCPLLVSTPCVPQAQSNG